MNDSSAVVYDNVQLTENTDNFDLHTENSLPENLYYWSVRRRWDGYWGVWQVVYQFRVDKTAPEAPTLTSPPPTTTISDNTVWLDWERPTLETDGTPENALPIVYKVLVANDSSFAAQNIVFDSESYYGKWIENDNLTLPELVDNTYYWEVRARDNAGNTGAYSSYQQFRIDTTPPQIPQPNDPTNGTGFTNINPTLSWPAVTLENDGDTELSTPVYYYVEISKDPDFLTGVESSGWRTENYWIPTIAYENGATYYWHVKARDNGPENPPGTPAPNESEYCTKESFTVDNEVSAPQLLNPVDNADVDGLSVTLQWQAVNDGGSGLENYYIEIDNDNDFSNGLYENALLPPTQTSYTFTGANIGHFYWHVKAIDVVGNENWSENRSFFLRQWFAFESWTGTLRGPVTWRMLESWTATVNVSSSLWQPYENWTVAIRAPVFPPRLISPRYGENINNQSPVFQWENLGAADNYRLVVDNSPNFDDGDNELDTYPAGTTNSYDISPQILQEGVWYWHMNQSRTNVTSEWSSTWWFRVDVTPPAAPTLRQPRDGENIGNVDDERDNTPFFDWDIVTTESDGGPENSLPLVYEIQIATDSGFNNIIYEDNLYSDNDNFDLHPADALPDNFYYWRVRATDNAGNTGAWSIRTFRVDTVAPEIPTMLYPINDEWAPVDPIIQWESVDENSKPVIYSIEISQYADFATTQESYTGTDNFYQPTTLFEKRWYWHVKARDNAGNETSWSSGKSFRVDGTTPTTPENLIPENFATYENGDNVKLEWANSIDDVNNNDWYSGIDNYHIQIATDPNFNNLIENYIIDNAGDPDASPTVPGENFHYFVFPDVGHYYWRVRVVDKVGHWSEWSEVHIVRISTWRVYETWTGTIHSRSIVWKATESWVGAVRSRAPGWKLIENWVGVVNAPVAWRFTESWTGAVHSTQAIWKAIESWVGLVQAKIAAWYLVENWSGTVRTRPLVWRFIEFWTGAVRCREVLWRSTDSWTGIVRTRTPTWKLVDSWSGNIKSRPVSWRLIEGWTGLIKSREVRWRFVEYWTGVVYSRQALWAALETWLVAVRTRLTVWSTADSWTGVIGSRRPKWRKREQWTGTIKSRIATWKSTESWSGTVKTKPVQWNSIESWNVTVRTREILWQGMESWTGSIQSKAILWNAIESWICQTKSITASWNFVESWSGTIKSKLVIWTAVEEWSGVVYIKEIVWNSIESWTGYVGSMPITWHKLDEWAGVVYAKSALWGEIETWSGSVIAPAIWQIADSWVVSVKAPAVWYAADSWYGQIDAPIPTPQPYAPSYGISITERWPTLRWDNYGSADNFHLLVDTEPSFTPPYRTDVWPISNAYTYDLLDPLMDGVYYWKVKQYRQSDPAAETGTSDWSEVWWFRVDTSAPAAPTLYEPEEGENTNDTTPLLNWTSTESQYLYSYPDVEFTYTGGTTDNDNAKADDGNYENIYEENTAPSDNYRLNVEHQITNIPSGIENVLQIEYYLAGDSENIIIYLENLANPGNWENIGVLDNHDASYASPTLFTYDLTGTNYCLNGEVHIRYAQEDNDSTRTSLMLEYTRVQTKKAATYESTYLYMDTENVHEGNTVDNDNAKADDGNYENIYEENFAASDEFRFDVEHVVTEIPDGKSHELQIEYYLAGDSENVTVYLENRKNLGEWENIGVLDNHTATAGSPALFTYDLTDTDYLFGWDLHIRFVQSDNDTSRTSLMLDYVRVLVRAGFYEYDDSPEYSLPVLYYAAISDDPNFPYENENSGWMENDNWTPTTLSDGIWYWRVKAKDNAGNESGWNTSYFRVDTAPPETPTRIYPQNNTWVPGTFNFTWYSVAENSLPVTYSVNVVDGSGNPITSTSTTDNYWNVTLSGGTYRWKIAARDDAGNWSGTSTEWTFWVDVIPPPAPDPLSPDNDSTTNVPDNTTFRWTKVIDNDIIGVEQSGVVRYWLQIATDNTFNNIYFENDNIPASENYFTYEPVLPDNLYFWHVCAVDNVGNVGNWSENWQFRVDTLPPQEVQLTEPDNNTIINDNTPDLRWVAGQDNSTPITYKTVITYENGDNAFVSDWITDNWLENSTYLPDNWYYWYVIARDNAGNQVQLDNYRFGIETSPPKVPEIYEPYNNASMSDNTPLLRWENVDSTDMTPPVSYYIWIATDPNFENIYLENGWIFENSWQISDENSLPENQYWWRLCARDNVTPPNVSDNTSTYTFRIDTTPPKATTLYTDNIDTENSSLQVNFGWENVTEETDGTPEGIVIYHFQLARGGDWDNQRGGLLENFETTDNSFTYTFSDYGSYFWRVRTRDNTVPSPNLGNWSEVRRITIAHWIVVDVWNGNVKTRTITWRALESWTIVTSSVPTLWRVVDNWYDNVAAPIPAPVLDSPPDGSTTNQTIITLDWHELQPADSYTYQVDNDQNGIPDFSDYIEATVIGSNDLISLAEGQYYWHVKQYRDSDNDGIAPGAYSPWSVTWLFFVDLTGPKAPDLYSPIPEENTNDNTPLFDWENVTTETDGGPENSIPVIYELEIATDSGFSNRVYWENNIENDNLTLPDENSLPDNFYYWRVRGWDAANNPGPWSTSSFRVDTVPPSAPQQVWPDNDSWTKPTVNLNWNPVTQDNLGNPENSLEVMYQAWLSQYSDFPPAARYESGWIYDDNWIPPATLLELKNWYWKVQARDNAGNISNWSPIWVFYADKDAPSKVNLYVPENQTVTNQTNITFEWTHATDDVDSNGWQSGLDNYHIQISTDNSFSTENIIYDNDNIPASENQHQYTFTSDGTYYWRVRAIDKVGWEGAWADNFWIRIDTTPPSGVALFYPDNNTIYSDNTPDLYWTKGQDNSPPIAYRVVVSLYEDFHENKLDSGWNTTWNFENSTHLGWENSGYLPDNWYYWKVLARDNAGNVYETPAWYMGIEASPPTLGNLLQPIENENLNDNTPLFYWENATDVTLPVSYYLWIATDPGFTNVVLENGWIYENEWEVPAENALSDGVYYFTYCARDNVSPPNVSENMSPPRRFRIDTTAPKTPALYTPENIDTENTALQVTFEWEKVTEEIDLTPEESGVIYLFQFARAGDWDNSDGRLLENFETTDNTFTYTFSDYGMYFWRVRARDNTTPTSNIGDWSEIRRITIARWVMIEEWNATVKSRVVGWKAVESWLNTVQSRSVLWRTVEVWTGLENAPVPPPMLVSPENNTNTKVKAVTFTWENVQAENKFHIQVATDIDFTNLVVNDPNVDPPTFTYVAGFTDNLYYWRVRQYRDNGDGIEDPQEWSIWSVVWQFRVDTDAPATPTDLRPENNTNLGNPTLGDNLDNTPMLDWTAVTTEADGDPEYSVPIKYEIQIATDSSFTNIVRMENVYDDNWEVTPALPDNFYYWRVRVWDNAGNVGSWSVTYKFHVDTVPPKAPELVSPLDDDPPLFLSWVRENANFDWLPAENQIDNTPELSSPIIYRIEISTSAGGTPIRENELTEDNWVVAPVFTSEYLYYWRVRATDNAGNVSEWSTIWDFRTDIKPPSQASLLIPDYLATFENGTTITFEWGAYDDYDDPEDAWSSGIKYYWIQIDDDNDFTNGVVYENQILTENTLDYVLPNVGHYYWRVCAIDAVGNIGSWSNTRILRIVTWRILETWSGNVKTRIVSWNLTESWSGIVRSKDTVWSAVETWVAVVKSKVASWYAVDDWVGTVQSKVSWRLVETWIGTVRAPTVWYAAETWIAAIQSRSVGWKLVESWSGKVDAPVPVPNLLSPANLSGFTYTTINFQWENLQAYDNFWLQIGTGPMGYYEENDNVSSEPTALVDGSARLGTNTGGSIENTKIQDGVYENIAEDNVGAVYTYVTSENVYEGGTDNMLRAQNSEGLFENIFENNYPLPPATLQLSENDTTVEVGNEVSGTSTDNLDIDDGNYYEVDSVASVGENVVEITHDSKPITVPTSWIDNIRIFLNLISENSATYTLQLYDWKNVEWDNLYTMTVGFSEENFDNVIVADIENFVSSNDNIRVRLVGENSTGSFRSREDYLLFEVNYTEPAYRENVQHNIANVGDADNYTLEILYYLVGDSENFEVWLENRQNPDEWNLVGYLDNHTADASSPALFTYDLTGSDYLGPGPDNVSMRFVQPDNDTTQTSLMIDYTGVRCENNTSTYGLRWEHRISNVDYGYENYLIRISGYTSDNENVSVYVWKNSTSEWIFLDNFDNTGTKTIEYTISGSDINDYLTDSSISILYRSADTTDSVQTTLYVDLAIVYENVYGLKPPLVVDKFVFNPYTTEDLPGTGVYYWHVKQFRQTTGTTLVGESEWSENWRFAVDITEPPIPNRVFPQPGQNVNDPSLTFTWEHSDDISLPVTYRVRVVKGVLSLRDSGEGLLENYWTLDGDSTASRRHIFMDYKGHRQRR